VETSAQLFIPPSHRSLTFFFFFLLVSLIILGGNSTDADHDPILTARNERKERIAKNERQASRNAASLGSAPTTSLASRLPAPAAYTAAKGKSRAEPSQEEKKNARTKRKEELERSMAITKGSTASLGRFDRLIEGEPKVKGVKRKVGSTFF
jgi:regulator of ribosome biosynthesis